MVAPVDAVGSPSGGTGATEEECKKNARCQAEAYASQLTDQAYAKACNKNSGYGRPSRSSYKF